MARERVRVPTEVGTRSRTKQSFRNETDINEIMAKYERMGILEHWNRREPRYGDFTSVADYQTSLECVRSAEAAFAALPAKVRDHCKNDPAELLRLVFDPTRESELRELGLIPKGEEAPEPKSPAPPSEVNK